jgi:hypothetical protein
MAPNQARGSRQQQQAARRPFIVGTRTVDKATYDQSRLLTTSTQDLPVYECDPNGFLGGLYILVQNVTAGNSANVTFAEDGPFNVIDTITLNDTNNKPLVGPWTGWDLYTAVKFGGYAFSDDARNNISYSATTSTGATGGSFTFVLRVPVELVHRDGLGALPNKSSSATFDVSMRLSANASIYGTAPTAAGTVRVRIQQFGWMDPNPIDMKGNPVAQNPPAIQTTQYWSKQTYTIGFGAFSQRLQGIDSLLRTIVFVLRDSTTTAPRANGDANFPDPFTMLYETSTPIQRIKAVWQYMIAEMYGYTATTVGINSRENGVYPESYARDFGHKPGAETRLGYLPSSAATTFNLSGTQGSTGTGPGVLTVLINKVVPAQGDPMLLTGR